MWDFASQNPGTAFLICWVLAWAAVQPFAYGFKAYNRHIRGKNIAAHGWPPEYLDADGDAVPKSE
jgi:hypothetical protein